MLKKLKS